MRAKSSNSLTDLFLYSKGLKTVIARIGSLPTVVSVRAGSKVPALAEVTTQRRSSEACRHSLSTLLPKLIYVMKLQMTMGRKIPWTNPSMKAEDWSILARQHFPVHNQSCYPLSQLLWIRLRSTCRDSQLLTWVRRPDPLVHPALISRSSSSTLLPYHSTKRC